MGREPWKTRLAALCRMDWLEVGIVVLCFAPCESQESHPIGVAYSNVLAVAWTRNCFLEEQVNPFTRHRLLSRGYCKGLQGSKSDSVLRLYAFYGSIEPHPMDLPSGSVEAT